MDWLTGINPFDKLSAYTFIYSLTGEIDVKVIVVNPHAKQLRKNEQIRRQIHTLFAAVAHIIDVQGRQSVIDELTSLHTHGNSIEALYVVGGDGTFNDILNWIVGLPADVRPGLISVGGGQFCYMTIFHGLKSKNPIKNLKRIFSGQIRLLAKPWQPIRIHDSLSGRTRHAAVVANGIISDIVQWYEDVGKGGFLKVLGVIVGASLSVMSDTIRKMHGRIKMAEGGLILGNRILKRRHYAGFALSTIPALLSSCRPFRGGPLNTQQFYGIVYAGGLRRLVLAAPFVWFGRSPFWIEPFMLNQPVEKAIVTTGDPRLLIDGDVAIWPGSTGKSHELRTLTFTAGEAIPLLFAAS